MGLGWVFICFRISAGIRTHGISELIEQSCVLSPASHNLPGDRLLLGVGLSVVLLLLLPLLEVLLLLQIVVLLLVVVELFWLLVVELLLWLLYVDGGGLLCIQIIVQTKYLYEHGLVWRTLTIPEVVLLYVILALILLR